MTEEDREFALLCPHCGQQNPPEFPVCWSCHGDLPAAPARPESSAPLPPLRSEALGGERRKRILLEFSIVLSLLWLPGLAAGIWDLGDPAPARIQSLADVLWNSAEGVSLLALLFYLAWLDGDWRRRFGLERPRIVREILWGLTVWVVMTLVSALMILITNRLGPESQPDSRLDFTPAALWIAPLYLLIWAWVEEVYFRAYLWNRLTELTRRPMLSIAISAVLFSAVHVYPLHASLSLFFWGALLGWIFAWRRSLWSLVLAHWLFNLAITYVY